jgi:DNA-binding transcriptional regulator YiaG
VSDVLSQDSGFNDNSPPAGDQPLSMNTLPLDQRIGYLRTRVLRVSQIELARLLGVDSRTVRRWEHGDSTPDETTLQMMADLAGIDSAWIIKGAGNAPPPARSPEDAARIAEELKLLGSRIRWVRTQILHESQAGFGEVVQVDARTVRRWERGESKPPTLLLRAIAEAVEIDAGWLLTGVGKPPKRNMQEDGWAVGDRELSPSDHSVPLPGRGRNPFSSQRDMKRLLYRIGPVGRESARKAEALETYSQLLGIAGIDLPNWWSKLREMVGKGRI